MVSPLVPWSDPAIQSGLGALMCSRVLFAACGPLVGGNVVAEGPEGGPDSLPFGELHVSFDVDAAGLHRRRKQTFALEARGGVDARRGLQGDDVKVAVGADEGIRVRGIARRGGVAPGTVVFELPIAEAGVAGVVGPCLGIGPGAQIGGVVELIAPHQSAGRNGGCELLCTHGAGRAIGDSDSLYGEVGSDGEGARYRVDCAVGVAPSVV